EHPIELVNSVNPYRLQGQKTAAFEVSDALGRAPDIHVLPVGNAGNISAYWMGYREYREAGVTDSLPRMWGFQAAGAAPFVAGHPITDPETVATAIRIGAPASWHLAVEARDDSGGLIDAVSDQQILDAQKMLAAEVGIFVEPAWRPAWRACCSSRRGDWSRPARRSRSPSPATASRTSTPRWDSTISRPPWSRRTSLRRRRPSACEDPEHPGLRERPGDLREPRPGLRRARPRPGPLRRPERRGDHRRGRDHRPGGGRRLGGRRRGPPRRARPAPRPRPRRRPADGAAAAGHEPHPARAR